MKSPRTLSLLSFAVAVLMTMSISTAHAAMSSSGEMIVVPEYVEAETKVKAEDFEGAIPLLNAALKKFPNHASAWNLLGFSHRRLGKFDEAEQYYEAALTVNPEHVGALNYMGQLFIQTGRPEKAKELLERLRKACNTGCDELAHLEKAIKEGVAVNY